MKKLLLFFVFIVAFSDYAQTSPCGTKVNDTFSVDGALPSGWVEYNTSGRVTVNTGRLKFDHNTTMPSAYRTFSPVTSNATFSFDVSATRNSVDCRINLVSSTGKYLASIAVGIGAASLKYATTITAGVPSGYLEWSPSVVFPTNTILTVSAQIDFVNQKIDLYNNGNLVMSGIPFLETTQDVAKIDIQLLYMYANNGQFYFDNISLISAEQNRILLLNTVTKAMTSLAEANIGTKYGQYSQPAVDAFQLAIDNANAVLANCTVSSTTIDNALTAFIAAQSAFAAAKVNDQVLKLYSGYDFSGDEHAMYCGYYNGTLGVNNDWAVSFTLQRGYMATFAENVNGSGVSKVYIAADNDLRINLPENLQKKISFIRVSPWNDVHKRGASGKSNDVVEALNSTWFYDWGSDDVSTTNTEYAVMNWSGGTTIDKMTKMGSTMNITHQLAFNEPDGVNQANMTVDKAIEQYAILQASGLRLGAPAVTDGAKGRAWLDEFMTKALAAGYRIDYLPVHYYKNSTTTSFYNWLKNLNDTYHIPIWVTEFHYGDIYDNASLTEAQVLTGFTSFVNMLDTTSFVERYCVFTWQPSESLPYSLMSVRTPITLSDSGVFYANHASPVAYTQEIYQQGQQLSVPSNTIPSNILIAPTLVTNGTLNVKYSNTIISNDVILNIYNLNGLLVKKVFGLNSKIDISALSSGIYIVKIHSGTQDFVQKIIVP